MINKCVSGCKLECSLTSMHIQFMRMQVISEANGLSWRCRGRRVCVWRAGLAMLHNVLRGRNELPTCRLVGVILKRGTVTVQLAADPNICKYCTNIAWISVHCVVRIIITANYTANRKNVPPNVGWSISLPNIDRFYISFTGMLSGQLAIKLS